VRIWDVSPGYLNRESLLGEHRELHGLHSILIHGKKGYSRHPETLRWVGCVSGLARRHAQLAAEMRLRGYIDRTPIDGRAGRLRWPAIFVTEPSLQYALLESKYRGRPHGRIPLPCTPHDIWAHHKYSVMARDPGACREIGRRVSRLRRRADLSPLAGELMLILRQAPPRGPLMNALEHMWGYVSALATAGDRASARASAAGLFARTRELAVRSRQPYLMSSTALSDLAVFVRGA